MSIKIHFSNKKTKKSQVNNVLFVEENFNITGLKRLISKNEFYYITVGNEKYSNPKAPENIEK